LDIRREFRNHSVLCRRNDVQCADAAADGADKNFREGVFSQVKPVDIEETVLHIRVGAGNHERFGGAGN